VEQHYICTVAEAPVIELNAGVDSIPMSLIGTGLGGDYDATAEINVGRDLWEITPYRFG
jgi:hypothetical protein